MKKTICMIMSLALVVTLFSGCGNSNNNTSEIIVVEEDIDDTTTQSSDIENTVSDNVTDDSSSEVDVSGNSSVESKVDSSECVHQYDEKVKQKAELFKAGTKSYTCTKCGDSYEKTYPVEKIKVLSISNSYGKNALWQLPEICKQAGVKEIDVAVMYIGGCSLDKHWENIQTGNAAYEVFRNNNGTWTSTQNCTIESLLAEGDWDVITTQNSSGLSGLADGYKNLNNVADYIKEKCPDSKLVWHLIWGYQSGSKWLTPDSYNGDEKFMYDSIVNCTKNIVVPSGKFDSVAPVGAAIMNARTSRLKTQVHQDDGSHLSEDIGYYIGAFTWFGHLTGMSLYDVNFVLLNPNVSQNIELIRESAENALENPYKITQSYYTN